VAAEPVRFRRGQQSIFERHKMKTTKKKTVKKTAVKSFEIGKCYLIRTVTYFQLGRLIGFGNRNQELILENVSWIADTGRFTQAMQSGDFFEVEMFPPGKVIVNRGAIVDAAEWSGRFPLVQK
jgi:hypothetical protein